MAGWRCRGPTSAAAWDRLAAEPPWLRLVQLRAAATAGTLSGGLAARPRSPGAASPPAAGPPT